MIWISVASAFALLGAIVWWLRRSLLIVTVDGPSMLPTYHDGDRVLVRRRIRRQPRTGDVVVVDLAFQAVSSPAGLEPSRPLTRRVIKRVAAVAGERAPTSVDSAQSIVPPGVLLLLGDNLSMSTDSRHYGHIAVDHVLGVVIGQLRQRSTRRWQPGGNQPGSTDA